MLLSVCRGGLSLGLVADSPENNLGGVSAAQLRHSGLGAAGQAYLRLYGRNVTARWALRSSGEWGSTRPSRGSTRPSRAVWV